MDFSPPSSSVHGDSPGKNIGVGCHAIFQGIFPTQGSNPGLQHCRQILYCLSHQGIPWKLETVVYPCSRGSSWLRNELRSPALQADILPAELPGKPTMEYEEWKLLSCVCLSVTPWTVAYQTLLCPWVSPGKNTAVSCRSLFQQWSIYSFKKEEYFDTPHGMDELGGQILWFHLSEEFRLTK